MKNISGDAECELKNTIWYCNFFIVSYIEFKMYVKFIHISFLIHIKRPKKY